MSGEFSIEIDAPRNLLRVRVWGFFSVEDVARYHAAVDESSVVLGGAPSRQRMLCDVTDMRIQSQEVVGAFREVMADPRYRGRRVAFVVATSLARAQVQRIIGERTALLFADEAGALVWLDSDQQDANAA